MDGGMSWTGGGPDMPKSPEGERAYWRDKRTCVLPVKLQSGHHYRVGINSMSYQNFRGTNGLPTAISAIYFTTSGAESENHRRRRSSASTRPTERARCQPWRRRNCASPSASQWARVVPGVAAVPISPRFLEGKKPYWTDDGKTCVLPVELKPGWEYGLGLNSPSYKGFQSAEGVPLTPVDYTFKTSDKP